MTENEALDILQHDVNMYLFDPLYGEKIEPSLLSEDNRNSLEATKYAINAILELKKMKERYYNIYFCNQYPEDGGLHVDNLEEAKKEFKCQCCYDNGGDLNCVPFQYQTNINDILNELDKANSEIKRLHNIILVGSSKMKYINKEQELSNTVQIHDLTKEEQELYNKAKNKDSVYIKKSIFWN